MSTNRPGMSRPAARSAVDGPDQAARLHPGAPDPAARLPPGAPDPAARLHPGAPDPAAPPGPHPGPARATLPAAIRDALVAHARAEYPNEACGLIAGTAPAAEGGAATRWHPTRNRAASPLRYEIHPDDLLRVFLAIDDADEVIWAIVHSHVRSPARPSPTDVGLALYPDALYLLVSLAADQVDPATGVAGPVTGAPSVRAWRIVDGAVFEVALDVAADGG